jgi:hypothetical protein
MLKTHLTIRVHCDTPGCPAVAERTVANTDVPRSMLAGARRSIVRRDGWKLGRRLIGSGEDVCPACVRSRDLVGPHPVTVTERAVALTGAPTDYQSSDFPSTSLNPPPAPTAARAAVPTASAPVTVIRLPEGGHAEETGGPVGFDLLAANLRSAADDRHRAPEPDDEPDDGDPAEDDPGLTDAELDELFDAGREALDAEGLEADDPPEAAAELEPEPATASAT